MTNRIDGIIKAANKCNLQNLMVYLMISSIPLVKINLILKLL